MKVTVEEYYNSTDVYLAETRKGRAVVFSLSLLDVDAYAKLGGYYKIRNDSLFEGGVYYPRSPYQFYELNPETGKKLRVVPDEL